MSLQLKLILLMLLAIFLFPQKVRAEYFVYAESHNGEEYFVEEEIKFIGEFSAAEKGFILFCNLLETENEIFMPEGTKVIGINIIDSTLILNVSPDVLNYGGTAYEQCIIQQILKTAAGLEEIDRITLLIDGENKPLTEGSIIFEMNLR